MSLRTELSIVWPVGFAAFAALAACGGRTGGPSSDVDASSPPGTPSATLPPASAQCIEGATKVREPLDGSFADNPLDPVGYMPFAEDGCGIVQVSKGGKLQRVSFDTGEREDLETSFSRASRPSARHGIVAWEAVDKNGRGIVRVKVGRAEPVTIPGSYAKAFEPRVGRDAVVFTLTYGNPDREDADTDVAVFTPSSGDVEIVASGPGQQRFGAIADDLVAYADFSEDPRGHFSLDDASSADIVVVTRSTKVTNRRVLPGKQAFPLLDDDGTLLYVDFGAVHPEPKFHALSLKVGKARGAADADRRVHATERIGGNIPWVQPSLRDGFVSWIEDDMQLFRRPVSLATPQVLVARADSGFVGVASGSLATFVASRARSDILLEGKATR